MNKGTSIKVEQYAGTRSAAKLKAKKKTTFDEGIYVVPLAQVSRKVIAVSLEPDVFDNNKSNKTETLSYIMKINQLYRYTGSDPINNLNMQLVPPVE
ncbi:MAG: hypothetical protein Q4A65_01975 [Bacillota bacterium]|nr:hypothetical protein [Bacillota bacterium]